MSKETMFQIIEKAREPSEILDAYIGVLKSMFGSAVHTIAVYYNDSFLVMTGSDAETARVISQEYKDGTQGYCLASDDGGCGMYSRFIYDSDNLLTVAVGTKRLVWKAKRYRSRMREIEQLLTYYLSSQCRVESGRSRFERCMEENSNNGSVLILGPANPKDLAGLVYYKKRLQEELEEGIAAIAPDSQVYYLDGGHFGIVSCMGSANFRKQMTSFYKDIAFHNEKLETVAAILPLSVYYANYMVPTAGIYKDATKMLSECDGLSIASILDKGDIRYE